MDAADSSSSPPPPLRIVICPWLAFGHLLPYLELAERLALRGHHVSFVSTPRNIARLPPLRPVAAPRVRLVALPLPRVDGLPDGVESTNNASGEAFKLLFQAFDGLAAPFAEFLDAEEGERPDWIIADTFNHWAAAAAIQHKVVHEKPIQLLINLHGFTAQIFLAKVPCVMLLPTAAMLASWMPRTPEESEAVASVFEPPAATAERPADVPRYEWEGKKKFFVKRSASDMSVAERCSLTLKRCTIAAMRSCVEWEGEAFTLVASQLGKPLVPLGLLPPSPDGGRSTTVINGEEPTVRRLDAQPPSSVVYVALGSEVRLQVEAVHELALGLELAGTRFLWALRKPSGVLDEHVLPPGFHERTHKQGMVTMGWVPQLSILAHDAVGAFLTHSGRNSLTEGLLFGHPLIMLPIVADQGPNARLMEERKVGLQVPKDENDGSFDRHGVASTIRAVMVEERELFVTTALKMQKVVADKELHERYVDDFVQHLVSHAT